MLPGLEPAAKHIDTSVRLVLTQRGPEYVGVSVIGDTIIVRRVRSLCCTREFGQILWRETMVG